MKHYLWLLSFAKPYWRRILYTWLISLVIIFLQTITVWISVQCIQNVLLEKNLFSGSDKFILSWLDDIADILLSNKAPHETLITGAVFLAVTMFLSSLMRYLKSFIFLNINERILSQIRTIIFSHISMLDLVFTQSKKTGEIESLLFHDVDNLTWGLIDTLDRLFMQPIRVIFFTYIIYQLSPLLTYVLYGVVSVSFVITHFFGKFLEWKSKVLMETTASLHGNAAEYLIVAILARIFNKEKYEQQRWREKSDELAMARIKSRMLQDLFPVTTSFFKSLSLLLIISIGANLVYAQEALVAADLAKIILLVPLLLYPIEALATLYGSIRQSMASIKRIRSVLAEKTALPKDQERAGLPEVTEPLFPIVGKKVVKKFEERNVLDGADFSVQQGETVVLYGPSGSGKSTLLSLLSGLSDYDDGDIFMGDNVLKEVDHVSWRNKLSIVLQDSIFFNTTIRENLEYTGVHCSDEEMIEVLKKVFPGDKQFTEEGSLDQVIGNLGKNLSGGERQRLSIARALLKDPALLILDEPTSDLDKNNREIIYDTLAKLKGSLTMIIATHDNDIRKIADKVYAIEKSQLVKTS